MTEHIEGIDGGVVVGIDGSKCARTALRYALEEARRRSAPLHVVRAWGLTNAPRPAGVSARYVPSFAEFAAATAEQVRAELAAVSAGAAGGPPDVQVHVVHAPPVRALLEAAAGADVAVVGSRGHGGFSGLLLGSVSEQVVRHAACPVVVVR